MIIKLKLKRAFLMSFILSLSISVNAEQQTANTPETKAPKTRTELLNELSLRTAQVTLEHAKEAHDRYESDYNNAKMLFNKSIINQKELDEALSAYTQAQQQLKQAEIQLEKTKLSFLDAHYDYGGQEIL
jgi:multidrug resistance efflux pump